MRGWGTTVRTAAGVLALGLLGAAPAPAQEPMQPAQPSDDTAALTDLRAAALDAEAAEIAAQLRCPVCSGQSVLESNSAIAQEMQEVIRERLDLGEGEEEILTYFRGAYGEWIVLKPEATGLNLVVYVLPAVVLVAGGIWLFFVVRRWSAASTAPAGSSSGARDSHGADLNPEDEAWLRESIGGG